MSNYYQRPLSPVPNAIEKQAMAWFARLRAESITKAEQARFSAWYEINPEHKKAYDEIKAFWNDADFTQLLSEMSLSPDLVKKLTVTQTKTKPLKFRTTYTLALAASIVFFIIIYRAEFSCLQADYCSAVGEIRTVQLADGSQITLNSNTALNVSFDNHQRSVELIQGEALFEVQRNPQKPFLVAGHFSNIKVLGTRFIVREETNTDTVSVVNGVVEVSPKQKTPEILHANDQIVVGEDHISDIQQIDAGITASWVKGRLLFDNVSLNDVITEISRYRHDRVIFKNAALKTLKVSGRFDIINTDKTLESLQQTLPIHIYKITPWLIVIA